MDNFVLFLWSWFIVLERKFLQIVFETMQVIIDKFSDILSVKSNILAKSLRHFCWCIKFTEKRNYIDITWYFYIISDTIWLFDLHDKWRPWQKFGLKFTYWLCRFKKKIWIHLFSSFFINKTSVNRDYQLVAYWRHYTTPPPEKPRFVIRANPLVLLSCSGHQRQNFSIAFS